MKGIFYSIRVLLIPKIVTLWKLKNSGYRSKHIDAPYPALKKGVLSNAIPTHFASFFSKGKYLKYVALFFELFPEAIHLQVRQTLPVIIINDPFGQEMLGKEVAKEHGKGYALLLRTNVMDKSEDLSVEQAGTYLSKVKDYFRFYS